MVLVPNRRKQHHGIDRDSSTAELSAPDSVNRGSNPGPLTTHSSQTAIFVPTPESARLRGLCLRGRVSWVVSTEAVGRNRPPVSGVGKHSPGRGGPPPPETRFAWRRDWLESEPLSGSVNRRSEVADSGLLSVCEGGVAGSAQSVKRSFRRLLSSAKYGYRQHLVQAER